MKLPNIDFSNVSACNIKSDFSNEAREKEQKLEVFFSKCTDSVSKKDTIKFEKTLNKIKKSGLRSPIIDPSMHLCLNYSLELDIIGKSNSFFSGDENLLKSKIQSKKPSMPKTGNANLKRFDENAYLLTISDKKLLSLDKRLNFSNTQKLENIRSDSVERQNIFDDQNVNSNLYLSECLFDFSPEFVDGTESYAIQFNDKVIYDIYNKFEYIYRDVLLSQYTSLSIYFISKNYGKIDICISTEKDKMKIDIGVSNRYFFDKILKKQSEIFHAIEEQSLSVSSLNFICQNDDSDSSESNFQEFQIVSSEKYSLKNEKSKNKILNFVNIIEHCLDF